MTPEIKAWIDNATYESLLRRWRFAPVGDPVFQGDVGQYYTKAMKRKRDELDPDDQVAVSKFVGWEKKP